MAKRRLDFFFGLIIVLAFLTACSGSADVADNEPPPNSLQGLYRGTFQNSTGSDSGQVELNLSDSDQLTSAGALAGTINFFGSSICLNNSTISGTQAGFSVSIMADQLDSSDANVTNALTLTLTASSNGNTLSGTYFSAACSNETGAGSISLQR